MKEEEIKLQNSIFAFKKYFKIYEKNYHTIISGIIWNYTSTAGF